MSSVPSLHLKGEESLNNIFFYASLIVNIAGILLQGMCLWQGMVWLRWWLLLFETVDHTTCPRWQTLVLQGIWRGETITERCQKLISSSLNMYKQSWKQTPIFIGRWGETARALDESRKSLWWSQLDQVWCLVFWDSHLGGLPLAV